MRKVGSITSTPISRAQANRFFTFISDTYETNSIVFTTNKEITDWAEMMGDPVLTTAMLDRILHHARCFSLQGQSYRLKHPELFSRLFSYKSSTIGKELPYLKKLLTVHCKKKLAGKKCLPSAEKTA